MSFGGKEWVKAVVGLVYVIASLSGSVWYVEILDPSLSNDLWWAGYNLTGYEAFLIDLCNHFLATHSCGSFDVLSPAARNQKSYSNIDASTDIYAPYIHNILLSELTSIEYAVPQLRQLSTYWSMRVNVQHCWVDFNQTFEIAHTQLRQERCQNQYKANAAVYLEAILRNQPWQQYLALWSGDGVRFNIAIERGLKETQRGREFLNAISIAYNSTTIAQELKYWRLYNFTMFKLQWQDRWLPGISETIVIENALGMEQPCTLKAMNQIVGPWSSNNLFWIPLNDLYNAMVWNRSLIRGTSNYFGSNVSASQPAINLEVYRGLADAKGNLVGQPLLFHNNVGPYLSIDCWYVSTPNLLIALYNDFHQALYHQLDASSELMSEYMALRNLIAVTPTPPRWSNYTYYGGDLMCISGSSTAYIQQSFDFYDPCTTQTPFSVPLTRERLVFSLFALESAASPQAICGLQSNPECYVALQAAANLMSKLSFSIEMTNLVSKVFADTQSLDVGIVQFAKFRNDSWVLLRQPLLGRAHEANWAFYGWVMLFDWALAQRQVLSFEGDAGTIVVISNAYASQTYNTGDQPLETATKMVYFLVVTTTVYLVAVGILLLLYSCRVGCRIVGTNLFCFNRIVGSVWVGRHLMMLRGMSAILLLSTSQLALTRSHGFTKFTKASRSWISTCLVAGEATWVVYCLNEFMVVFFKQLTPIYSPWSTTLSWGAIVLLEWNAPVEFVVNIDRKCFGNDMDYGVSCTSGKIQVGSFTRVCVLVGMQVSIVFLSLLCGELYRRRRASNIIELYTESTLISGLPEAFIGSASKSHQYDQATCVMCGIIPITLHTKRFVFDMKLWTLMTDNISVDTPASLTSLVHAFPSSISVEALKRQAHRNMGILAKFDQRWSVLTSFCGLFYMVVSIASSLSYFEISQVNLGNDLYWATFNVTGAHTFFATWLNEQLVLGIPNQSLQLDDTCINLLGSFNSTTSSVSTVNNYGAWLQHNELSNISKAIAGIRALDSCKAPWIFTQYCYLDFNQTWEMAYSQSRQLRCRAVRFNGAIYLESVLRNLIWTDWMECWGEAFAIAFENELLRSTQGSQWLQGVATSNLSLIDEVAYWESYDIQSFDVQWQNYKRIGVVNSYNIINAYGVVYPMPLMTLNTTYRVASQTTFKMYWSFANDLFSIVNNGSGMEYTSLLRMSSNFAFLNTTPQAILTRNLTLMAPLAAGLTLIQDTIGPFGVIDMVYVKVPHAVSTFFNSVIAFTRSTLSSNLSAQIAYTNISLLGISYPVPKKWLEYYSYGSSPLCQELRTGKRITSGFLSFLSYDLTCQPTLPINAKVVPSRQHYVLSVLLSGLLSLPSSEYRSICLFDPTYAAQCLVYVQQTIEFVKTYMPRASDMFNVSAATVSALVQDLNIEFMMYARTNTSAPLTLLRSRIFDPKEANFTFFAWTYLYDWVVGNREVIRFHGDVGNIAILTDLELPLLQQVKPWLLTADVAQYCRVGVWYVTFIMLCVAFGACCYMVVSQFQFVGANMFSLCRVGGMVWVGRPLLFLRSLTALCLLSTCTFELLYSGYVSFFTKVATPWYKVMLAAGETTWLVSVVNDIVLVLTKEHSLYYETPSTLIIWIVGGVLSWWQPIQANVVLEKECFLAGIDEQVVCSSGAIHIGQPTRLLTLVGLVLLSNMLCYALVRWKLGKLAHCPIDSPLLSSRAKYLFIHTHRQVDHLYYLDRASALLDGLVTVQYRQSIYCLDIKLWRIFVTALHDERHLPASPTASLLATAYPLVNQAKE